MRVSVSVILPVYNVEPYIAACIESLQAQTLRDLEFIFVDDCSTDGSMESVEAWAEKGSRVRILRNKKNIGPGPSRNRGIEEASGEYLSFVDPDDYVSPDFYELLFSAATADGGHDIAKGSRCKVDGETGEKGSAGQHLNGLIGSRGEDAPLYRSFTCEHQSAIYRRRLFADGGARYGSTRNSEDITFLLRCCYQTEDIVLEEAATYYYVQHPGSAVHGTGAERTYAELDALAESIDFLGEKGFDDEARQYLLRKAQVRLRRFRELLAEGRADPGDYEPVAEKLRELLRRIPDAEAACKDWPQLDKILAGRPIDASGKREERSLMGMLKRGINALKWTSDS